MISKNKVYRTKKTEYGWWIEYRYIGDSKDGRPVFQERAVFPDGHKERFRVFGGIITGYTNTRLGLRLWEPPEDILEVLSKLPDNALIET